jgi:hypothetical protein
MAAGSMDISIPGKYPVVLSDALLSKTTQETYASIRCTRAPFPSYGPTCLTASLDNHKPDAAASQSLSAMQLQASKSDASSLDLSFSDDSGKYKYSGVRASGDGQYVLIFNPEKEHFVLHRIDATFDVNLVSAPWEKNASALRSQYSQLESAAKPRAEAPPRRRKPTQAKKKPPVHEPAPREDEDSDDGLTIEYPDAPSSRQYKPRPEPVSPQNASEDDDDEEEDVEGELDEQRNQDVDHLTLLSPANNHSSGAGDEDMELDLEAELEQALKETREGAGDDESDESEEE